MRTVKVSNSAACRRRAHQTLGWAWPLALVGLGAPLVALAVLGFSSRYAADDYCTAAQVRMAGFMEAQSRLYVGWSGRFAATLLITSLELVGAVAVQFLPLLALAAWLTAATWALRELLAASGQPASVLRGAVLATLIVFATLQTTADVPQILYWQTGTATYLWPLVLATLFVGWVAHVAHRGAMRGPVAIGVSFALAVLAGGTSETFVAAEVTALALALVVAVLARRGGMVGLLVVGMLGALLALALVAVSPGNAVRQETATPTPLLVALARAIEFTQGWLRLTFARPHAIVLLLLVGIPAAMAAAAQMVSNTPVNSTCASRRSEDGADTDRWRRWLVGALGGLAAAALVILASMLPAFYALGSNPPGRAQLIPQFVLVCCLAALGWISGSALAPYLRNVPNRSAPSWVAVAALAVLLALGPLSATRDTLLQLAPARAYAAAWDQLDQDVRTERTAGVQDVTVRPLPSTGLVQNLDFVGPDRNDWFNDCVARYYGLNSIAGTLSLP